MHFGQRGHLDGIVDDKGGLNERTLAEFAEDFVYQFALAHGVIDLEVELLAHLADFLLGLAFQVVTCLFLNGLEDGQTAVRRLEADDLPVDFGLGLAVDGDTDCLEQLFGERHHPVIVLVLHVQLHAGELGIVVAVHALVAEILADFIHTLKTADNQSL